MTVPIGTVTFLFTDIESSTRLWEQQPEVMRLALVRHNALLRNEIEANRGFVFKTIGDAFCAAFATAPEALAAALSAQRALTTEVWDGGIELNVRMALHTGAVELRDNDYFGPPLNRVARLLSAGHGGQTLLSDVTQELARDNLPAGAALRPLGKHRLKDLFRPEIVFQLLHPQLPSDFPPLKSLDNPELPNNLPVQVTSFIGRENEMATIQDLLVKTRILTLTGSGGCGKTRLALQVAADTLERFPDGVWLVELAPLADPSLVVQSVAHAVRVKEDASKPLQQTLTEALKSGRLLFVLDNCEHLLSACALLADTLVRQCPQVKLLATSREGLGIAGELTYRVPSLSQPDPAQSHTSETLSQFEAVRLFIDRAQFHQPTFSVTNRNAPALASVCHHLDGIPLAIELAAARVRSLPIEEIEARLGQRFRLLTGGSRTALPRQQTLQAAVDWSYDLLNEQEKTVLHRVSVFAGGWTLAAAESVCSGEAIAEFEVVDTLTSLVDKSLVLYEERAGQGRYNLLETVRQYARERLAATGEETLWCTRHLDYFLPLAERFYEKRFTDEAPALLELLDAEHDNCRAAVDFCATNADPQIHLRMVGAFCRFWQWRGHYREGRAKLAAALDRPGSRLHTAPRARALYEAGVLAMDQNDPEASRQLIEKSVELWRELGSKRALAMALNGLGVLERNELRYDLAHAFFDESLTLMRELNDQVGMALLLTNFGYLARLQNDFDQAHALLEEGIDLCRRTGNLFVLQGALSYLGQLAMQQSDYAAARAPLRESLGLLAASRSDLYLLEALEPVAELAACFQNPREGVRVFAACAALRKRSGLTVLPSDRADYERRERLLQSSLGQEPFSEEWEAGSVLATEDAIAVAQEILSAEIL